MAVEAYGVRVSVEATDRELLDRAVAVLPPGWRRCEPSEVEASYALLKDNGRYRVRQGGVPASECADPEIAIGVFDSMLRGHIASVAPDRVFVHAGVVSHEGRAIILPGHSVSGKTTLVVALVEAGAAYISEEYAVLDEQGRVHPYPRPLSIRAPGHPRGVGTPVEDLGGVVAQGPLPVGVVAVTSYRPGARWNPRRLSPAAGALAVLEHTIAARERPAESLAAVRGALPEVVLEGERGEAAETAAALLAAASDSA